ncbi:MAG: hypothetical protein WCF18_05740 [Chthoniobacteraceae bacterium]
MFHLRFLAAIPSVPLAIEHARAVEAEAPPGKSVADIRWRSSGEARRIHEETSEGKGDEVTEVFTSDDRLDLAILKIAWKD